MDLVVDFPIQGVDGNPRSLVEFGVLAEKAGWDGVSLEDYVSYYRDGPLFDPWIVLAAIAARKPGASRHHRVPPDPSATLEGSP